MLLRSQHETVDLVFLCILISALCDVLLHYLCILERLIRRKFLKLVLPSLLLHPLLGLLALDCDMVNCVRR